MRRSRQVALGLGTVVVAGCVAGLVATGALDPLGGGPTTPPGEAAGPTPSPDDSSGSPQPPPPPDLNLPQPAPIDDPVLAPARGPVPDARAVRAVLGPVLSDRRLGRHTGVVVRDLTRDRPVLTVGDPDPYVPASTLKLFTAAAALAELGPDHRFTTSVVLEQRGRGSPPSVVLVGGGDPLLASGRPDPGEVDVSGIVSVTGLAVETARALREHGVRRVRVAYDASAFAGPAVAPTWEPNYLPDDVVSTVSALWVDEGRVVPGGAERVPDPALAAGDAFAAALQRRGVGVQGAPRVATAAPQAELLAEAAGADLESVVEHVLLVSDNEAAEVLLRHVGLATGRAGSFAGGVAGVREVLTRLGVPYTGVRTYDGSGLSRANRITLAALSQVLQLGAHPDQPELRTVTSGLPVARFSGSLASRFLAPEALAGRGVVRAKTGTLSNVNGLAGTVVTRDGTLLGFGLLTDAVRIRDTLDARALLDEMAAALAGCGC